MRNGGHVKKYLKDSFKFFYIKIREKIVQIERFITIYTVKNISHGDIILIPKLFLFSLNLIKSGKTYFADIFQNENVDGPSSIF